MCGLLIRVTVGAHLFATALALQNPPPPPPPPYFFPNARVLYQPALVPVAAARAVTPCSSSDPEAGLTLLSLFGWTLGGVFAVEWADSPVGPYREVAVLSGLVWKGFGSGLGAWASHIVVTTAEASTAGREVFGLPTRVGCLDFLPVVPTAPSSFSSSPLRAPRTDGPAGFDGDDGRDAELWRRDLAAMARGAARVLRNVAEDAAVALKYATGAAVPGVAEPAERLRRQTIRGPAVPSVGVNDEGARGFWFSGDGTEVTVRGWDGWDDHALQSEGHNVNGEERRGVSLSLPSFSGRLREDGEEAVTPLLQYDLGLGPAHRLRLRPAMRTAILPNDGPRNEAPTTLQLKMSPELKAVLGGPCVCPCIQVDGVLIVAGCPEAVGV